MQRVENSVELAAALGRDPSTVRRWFTRKDWPFGSDGPFDVSAVLLWEAREIGRRRYGHDRTPAAKPSPDAADSDNGTLPSIHDLDLATASRQELDRFAKCEKALQAREERLRARGAWVSREDFDEALVALGEIMRRDLLELGRSLEAEYPDVQGEIIPRLERLLHRMADRIEADQKRGR